MHTRARAYLHAHVRDHTGYGGGRWERGRDISEAVETEVDKQTCRRPRGHRKHGGVADAGGAVKREIRVHPRARFSIVRPAGLRREAGTGISRWKLICRDGKYRRRRTVSSWKYVALPGIRVAMVYLRSCTRSICTSAHARPYKGSDFNRIARETSRKNISAKKSRYRRALALSQ